MQKLKEIAQAALMPILLVVLGVLGVYSYVISNDRTQLQETVTQLSQKVGQQASELTAAGETNSRLNRELEKYQRSNDITSDVKDKLTELEKADQKRYDEMQKQVSEKLKAIDSKYAAMAPSPDNSDRKAVEISLERSRGVWLLYCLAEPAAKECN